jgi:hypothetical protein
MNRTIAHELGQELPITTVPLPCDKLAAGVAAMVHEVVDAHGRLGARTTRTLSKTSPTA